MFGTNDVMHFKFYRLIDFDKRYLCHEKHGASRGLSATAELLVVLL